MSEIEHAGLEDGPEDPEIRRAKTVLFVVAISILLTLILILVLFFQPEGQVKVTSHPNGYRATRTHYVSDPGGRPVAHGEHRAWYMDGTPRERGDYENGVRVGSWRFWREDGLLDETRSGVYEKDERVGSLP